VGARVIRQPGVLQLRRKKEERRALVLIIGAISLPLFLAFFLVAADMRSDLSELKPIQASNDHATTLIGWGDLEVPEGQSASTMLAQRQVSKQVRMLGYMMDGYPPSGDGKPVQMFIMMPEAGHILHPAHRIPDEMVEVRLKHSAPFKFRTLVWASGALAQISSRPKYGNPMYAMIDASVEPAAQSDITRWFTP